MKMNDKHGTNVNPYRINYIQKCDRTFRKIIKEHIFKPNEYGSDYTDYIIYINFKGCCLDLHYKTDEARQKDLDSLDIVLKEVWRRENNL